MVPYPKPKKMGGELIRRVVKSLREAGLRLPIDSHILIGVSGGADSLALARLLTQYGRRVVAKEKITLIHVNHGWRGKQADIEAKSVGLFAREWGVGFIGKKVAPPQRKKDGGTGRSFEDDAREKRLSIFESEAKKRSALVFTAHQAEDLAETVLWRLLTGTMSTHGEGIRVKSGVQVRPFLEVTKSEIHRFLKEEGLQWFEDPTNREGNFLRARLRRDVFPALVQVFPRAVQRLNELARASEGAQGDEDPATLPPGIFLRKAHWDELSQQLKRSQGRIHLPNGWELEFSKTKRLERWTFERKKRE